MGGCLRTLPTPHAAHGECGGQPARWRPARRAILWAAIMPRIVVVSAVSPRSSVQTSAGTREAAPFVALRASQRGYGVW
jgi:hypothetical protein